LTKAIELNPNTASFYYFCRISYAAKGEHDQANGGLTKYIVLNPNDPSGYHARGGSLAAKRNRSRDLPIIGASSGCRRHP
jgi:hypothetical protein